MAGKPPVTNDQTDWSLVIVVSSRTRYKSIILSASSAPTARYVMRVRLVPMEGGTPVDIHKDLSLVGRREDCDIFLDHKSISKLHCVVARTDGLLLLRDLGSTNGTRVNGQRVRRAALLPNDHLAIANLKFQVRFGNELLAENAALPNGAAETSKLPMRMNA